MKRGMKHRQARRVKAENAEPFDRIPRPDEPLPYVIVGGEVVGRFIEMEGDYFIVDEADKGDSR